jgi:Holliday junction DNA helicase RuvA
MIGYLKGKVLSSDEKALILEVNGVGYEVFVTLNHLFELKKGDNLELFIHTNVREDNITLFGFTKLDDRELFRKLIGVSGVGPKSGLTMLSVSTSANIIRAIESGNADLFPKIPGVGKKTLEKVILELKGKLDTKIAYSNESADMRDARLALETLGYNARDISEVLNKINPDLDMNSAIKESLKMLAK